MAETGTHGKGIHSIRWRFALAAAVLALAGTALREWWLGHGVPAAELPSMLLLAAATAMATYAMASRLTGLIETLKASTEAIAAGEFDAPVDIDCACEVGGLAQSFRKMRTRLNDNILRINTLAHTDPITGLPNRAVVDEVLGWALAPERAGEFKAAIVFIDLDGFKRVNDTLGHAAGDELLRQASTRLLERGLNRSVDSLDRCIDEFGNPCRRLPQDLLFARFAGDEFVAILPGSTNRDELARTGAALVEALRAPFHIAGHDVNISASVGIAVTPDDTTSATELLSYADLAMFSSKQAGKGRWSFFDQRVRERLVEFTRVEAELRGAIAAGQLVLHFQPKFDARTRAPLGVEALVRWQHPERGLLFPGAFIDAAEQAGLMSALGSHVLELAVAQCRAWLDAGIERPVAVNVSPSQFNDEGFVPGVLAVLRRARVPTHLLSVEITESMAMTDFETTAARLAELRDAGVRVAVDDFGIGFSNLSQLSRLPVDEVKIDRSLVSDIGQSPKSEAIIRAVVAMTHALGYGTIAEGIETPQQLAFLADCGCDAAQGYLLGRPVAAERLDTPVAPREAVPA